MTEGPGKTIWGEQKKKWFFDTVRKSDATFRILISPTPIIGPDRDNKKDNHSNKVFQHEGDEVRKFLSGFDNAFVLCGDRHWQYYTIDPATGVREFSSGAGADVHAGGFNQKLRTDAHQFLRIAGGFLTVSTTRNGNVANIVFQHHNVEGDVVNRAHFSVHAP